MKAGIITTSYANNYGALLQTYALQETLRDKLNIEPSIFSYYPKWYKRSWSLFPKPRNFRELLSQIIRVVNLKSDIRFFQRKSNNKRFRNNYLNLTEFSFSNTEEIENETCDIDCLIAGSDQVWNIHLMPDLNVFFLNFWNNKNIKKISYAASVSTPVFENEFKMVDDYLKRIDSISVRESDDAIVLEKITGRKINVTCDPTFLIDKEKWTELSKNSKYSNKKMDKYIFCYFLEVSKKDIAFVKKIKKESGLKVFSVCLTAYEKLPADISTGNVSPIDFIYLINNADIVITNSFHCTAFSINLNKEYFTMCKNVSNNRILSIEKLLNIKSRMVFQDNLESVSLFTTETINYEEVNRRLSDFRDKSLAFLEKEINDR